MLWREGVLGPHSARKQQKKLTELTCLLRCDSDEVVWHKASLSSAYTPPCKTWYLPLLFSSQHKSRQHAAVKALPAVLSMGFHFVVIFYLHFFYTMQRDQKRVYIYLHTYIEAINFCCTNDAVKSCFRGVSEFFAFCLSTFPFRSFFFVISCSEWCVCAGVFVCARLFGITCDCACPLSSLEFALFFSCGEPLFCSKPGYMPCPHALGFVF